MKLDHMFDFTENHRFYMLREFSLSPMDDKVLSLMYQPMIGIGACALYKLLSVQLPSERLGYSEVEQQRKLFMGLGAEPGDKGRKYLADCASKLEAVGLMHTYRKTNTSREETVYFYHLMPPMNPFEFFRNQHLTLLLRDQVGKHGVLQLHQEFCVTEPEDWTEAMVESESLSVPFYDLFELNTQVIDYEFEQALAELAPAHSGFSQEKPGLEGFQYSEIIHQFPRLSQNRVYVEQLSTKMEELQAINYVARKYKLTLQETCRLLDEDHVFNAAGELELDTLQHHANLIYRQGKRRGEERERLLQHKPKDAAKPLAMEKTVDEGHLLELPAFLQDKCDIQQYNVILRNKPYLEILDMFFPGSIPDPILNIFERIDLHYKLEEEVINVLIHYLKCYNLSWTRSFVETVAADMLGKQIQSYEQAVRYIRDQAEMKNQGKTRGSGRSSGGRSAGKTGTGKGTSKPKLPVYKGDEEPAVTDEEYEEILRRVRERAGGNG